jgi:peptide/nickel transport system substrate-binding protein
MTDRQSGFTRRAFLHAAGAMTLADLLFPSEAKAQAPKKGGKLVYTSGSHNVQHKALETARHPYYGIEIRTSNTYNQLTWVNENLEVEPELATKWEAVSADQKVWEVEIRQGVKFHDGRDMRVEDVVASYELHKDPKLGTSFARDMLDKVEKAGPTKVRFLLKEPNSELGWWLAEYRQAIMPADALDKMGFAGIGTGPFKFAKIDPQRRVIYEANPNYWREGPYLETLECVMQKGMDPLSAYLSGQFDVVASLDPSLVGQLSARADTRLEFASAGDQFLVVLPKHEGSPFLDKRIRQALTLAINREAIIRIVYAGKAGWLPNDTHMTSVNEDFLAKTPLRDVAKAKQLLAEAGHPNGIKLPTLYFAPMFTEVARVFQVVSESVKEAGITLPIEERPLSGYRQWRVEDKEKGVRHRFAMGPSGTRNAGANMFRMARPTYNESGYWHPSPKGDEYIALYKKAMTTADRAARRAIYHEMQRILHDEVPALFVVGRREIHAQRASVMGLKAHPQHWSFGFDKVWRA